MSLVSRLIGLVSDAIGPIADGEANPDRPSDRSLAVAALLVHVARVDGRLAPVESERVAALLRERLGLTVTAAAQLLSRGDALDRETDDIADLVEMLGHSVPLAERRGLLAMAYAVAAADGVVAEFEEDLIWRVGHLLGLSEAEIATARDDAGDQAAGAARTLGPVA